MSRELYPDQGIQPLRGKAIEREPSCFSDSASRDIDGTGAGRSELVWTDPTARLDAPPVHALLASLQLRFQIRPLLETASPSLPSPAPSRLP